MDVFHDAVCQCLDFQRKLLLGGFRTNFFFSTPMHKKGFEEVDAPSTSIGKDHMSILNLDSSRTAR
jgi:hypothetical protein